MVWKTPIKRTVMKPVPNRLVVYPNDVRNITGRCYRSSRILLQNIRTAYGKKKGAFVSLQEFCRYMELEEDFVKAFLK